MPRQRVRLCVSERYSCAQVEQIKLGVMPHDMDDRWYIVYHDATGTLRIHRSWTGTCIYEALVTVAEGGEGFVIAEAWANRDPRDYGCRDDAKDAAVLVWLINTLLLEDLDAPDPWGARWAPIPVVALATTHHM